MVLPVTLEIGIGWTRDVSASGLYLKLSDKPCRPPEASTIKLDLVLEHVNPDRPVKVACEGEIVRIENAPTHVGLALRISSYDFDISQAFRDDFETGLWHRTETAREVKRPRLNST